MTRRERLRDEPVERAQSDDAGADRADPPVSCTCLPTRNRRNSFIAAAIYAVCALTDWMDGWLARISNKVTTLGEVSSTRLADKVIVISALAMLVKARGVCSGVGGWW